MPASARRRQSAQRPGSGRKVTRRSGVPCRQFWRLPLPGLPGVHPKGRPPGWRPRRLRHIVRTVRTDPTGPARRPSSASRPEIKKFLPSIRRGSMNLRCTRRSSRRRAFLRTRMGACSIHCCAAISQIRAWTSSPLWKRERRVGSPRQHGQGDLRRGHRWPRGDAGRAAAPPEALLELHRRPRRQENQGGAPGPLVQPDAEDLVRARGHASHAAAHLRGSGERRLPGRTAHPPQCPRRERNSGATPAVGGHDLLRRRDAPPVSGRGCCGRFR